MQMDTLRNTTWYIDKLHDRAPRRTVDNETVYHLRHHSPSIHTLSKRRRCLVLFLHRNVSGPDDPTAQVGHVREQECEAQESRRIRISTCAKVVLLWDAGLSCLLPYRYVLMSWIVNS